MTKDQVYARIRKHCLAKEGAIEEYPWDDVVWKVRGKIFAGSSDGSNQVTVKSTPEEQSHLIEHPAVEVAKYVGRFGWVTVTITNKKTLDLGLELVDESYRSLAPKRKQTRSTSRGKSPGAPRLKRLEPSVLPLTPGRWKDFVKLFGPRGACAGCWCMEPRQTRSEWEKKKGATNRRLMKRLVDKGKRPPGLLAYIDGEPVGWISIEPRDVFTKLSLSRVLAAVDDKPVWSIVCFFVDKEYRNSGLSVALIEGAVEYARKRGARIVEGYPVEPKKKPMPPVFAFSGLATAYRKARFKEVARRSETRPIMRRAVRR
jgi:predicted DNA-binding protein (MmcQ/YjbR family)/GNAT superfamily N-acetyltransferase